MKFARPRIVEHNNTGLFDAAGNPCTAAVTLQTQVDDLILGNGTNRTILRGDGNWYTALSIALPAAYAANCTFEMLLSGQRQVFMHVNTKVLGAGALTGVTCLMEFNDPDHPEFWIPSKEGVARDTALGTHQWTLLGLGNWVVATRVEHPHFTKFRARFQAAAGAADATTTIAVSWYTDSGPSMLREQVN